MGDDNPDNSHSRASRPSRQFTSDHEETLTRIDERLEHIDENVTEQLERHSETLDEHEKQIAANDNRSRKNRTLINIATGGIGAIITLTQTKISQVLGLIN